MEDPINDFFGPDDAQKFAAQAAEQTPQQLGQTLKDAGVDLGDYGPRKQENLYDLNAGSMMGGPQTAPPDQAFYGQLTRGPDGTLRGVGPGTIYDRQQILQNALTAGLLNPASDQYQQAIAQQSQQQQAAQNPGNLAAVYQSIKLTPAQESRIAQLDRAAEDVIKRSLSGMLSQREATVYLGQIESLVAPLKQQRAQSVRVFQDMEEIRIRDEAAKAKAIQHSNLLADAQSAQQRVVNLQDAQGNTHSFYMDTTGKMLPLSGGAGKAADKIVPFDSTKQLAESTADAKVELAKSGKLYDEEGKEKNGEVMKRAAEIFEARRSQHEQGMKANADRRAGIQPQQAPPPEQQQPPPGSGVNIPEGWTPKPKEPPLPANADGAKKELDVMKEVYKNITNAPPEMQRRALELRKILNGGK